MTAGEMLKPHRCTSWRRDPPIAPRVESDENRHQFRSGLGQLVLEPGRPLVVLPPLEYPVRLEVCETGSEKIPRDPKVLDQLVEPVQPHGDIPDDERCPPVADDVEASSERAMEVGETRLTHDKQIYVTSCCIELT